jgi:chlorosome envelope protein E
MSKLSGVFTKGAESYGRFVEVFIDGHWWVVGDALENIGKSTKRLLNIAYPFLNGDFRSLGLRGSSPKVSGYARPGKDIEKRFKD